MIWSMGKVKEKHIGILLKYPQREEVNVDRCRGESNAPREQVNVGFIGAGSFAQSYLIPNVKVLVLPLMVSSPHVGSVPECSGKIRLQLLFFRARRCLALEGD
ncbi:MAG: hypothetical protein R2824_23870 [Saprospiraceae bacterium]